MRPLTPRQLYALEVLAALNLPWPDSDALGGLLGDATAWRVCRQLEKQGLVTECEGSYAINDAGIAALEAGKKDGPS